MIPPMNLGAVVHQWNQARRSVGLGPLVYSIRLARYGAQYLANWRPGLDPEANVSRYPAVLVQMAPAAGWTPSMVAQGLIGSPYHAARILSPWVSKVGIVEVWRGADAVVIAEFGGPAPAKVPPFVVWAPPILSSGLESWQDWEYPNPFPALHEGQGAGYPIMVRSTADDGGVIGAEIETASGRRVPVWLDEGGDVHSTAAIIAPKVPLPPGQYLFRFWWVPGAAGKRPYVVQRPFTVQ